MYCTCPTWIYGSTKYIAAHVCILYIICVCLLEVTSCKRYIFLFVQCHSMPAHEGCFPCKTAHSHRILMQAPVYILLSTVQDTHAVFCIIYCTAKAGIYIQAVESVAMDNYCNWGRQIWAFFILLAICIVVLLSATALGEWSK